MKFAKYAIGVSTLALTMLAAPPANDPHYNPATVVDVLGTVTGVRQVPAGSPLPGVHLTVKSKAAAFDVYLGPSNFLKFLKADYIVGDQIEVTGSKVIAGNEQVILSSQVDDGFELLTLRDPDGGAAWENWGREIDPALVQ